MIKPRITAYMENCLVCGGPAEWHHTLHGTARRRLASEDGLVVPLCRMHHRIGDDSAHHSNTTDKLLQVIGQQAYIISKMEEGLSREEAMEEFQKRYGRSYI